MLEDGCRRAAGAVVFGPSGLLVIEDRFGRWTLPKGGIEPGETAPEAAAREVEEETGIPVDVLEGLGEVRYRFWSRGLLRCKRVTYFLARARGRDLQPAAGEVAGARWVDPSDFLDHCDYEENRIIYRRGLERVSSRFTDVDCRPTNR